VLNFFSDYQLLTCAIVISSKIICVRRDAVIFGDYCRTDEKQIRSCLRDKYNIAENIYMYYISKNWQNGTIQTKTHSGKRISNGLFTADHKRARNKSFLTTRFSVFLFSFGSQIKYHDFFFIHIYIQNNIVHWIFWTFLKRTKRQRPLYIVYKNGNLATTDVYFAIYLYEYILYKTRLSSQTSGKIRSQTINLSLRVSETGLNRQFHLATVDYYVEGIYPRTVAVVTHSVYKSFGEKSIQEAYVRMYTVYHEIFNISYTLKSEKKR